MLSALGISSSAVPAGLCILGTQKKSKFVLEIPSHPCYNIHMNKQEAKAIDEATAKAEADLIIKEALERGGMEFLHYLMGWMQFTHYADMAKAAESWIEMQNFELPEED